MTKEQDMRAMRADLYKKEKSDLRCPNCGEKYSGHLNKHNRIKGISRFWEQIDVKNGVFTSKRHEYFKWVCNTCEFTWYTRN